MTAAAWSAIVERHHRAILVGSLVLAAAAALSLTRLRLDIDVLGMLPRGEPAFDDFKAFAAEFGQLDELLILVDGPRPARETVAAALAARLSALPTIRSVQGRLDSAGAADALLGPYLFNYIPLDDYDEVRQRLTPAGVAAQVAANKAILAAPFDVSLAHTVAADPLGLRRLAARHLADAAGGVLPDLDGGWLTARDGGALLLLARPRGSPFDIAFSTALLADVRAAAAAVGQDGVRIALTGGYAFALEDAATLRADIQRYTLLSLAAVLAVFWLGYGNLRVLPFVTFPLILSTLLTFAVSLLLFDQLNALSLSFAAILYGLSIDSGIHFYSRLLEASGRGAAPRAAVAETLASLCRAHLASAATTAAAFLVIAFSVLSVVRQLGVLTAVGMAITTLQFFLLYPALGFLLLRRGGAAPRRLTTPRLGAWAATARRHGRLVGAATLLAAAISAAAATRVALDPTLQRLRPADSPALRVQEEIAARFTRPAAGAVLVSGATPEDALVAGEQVAAALRAARDAGLVASLQSVDALLPSAATQQARLAAAATLRRGEALATLDTAMRAHGFRPQSFAEFTAAFAAAPRALVTAEAAALAPFAPAVERHLRVRTDGAAAVAAYVEPAPGVAWTDLAARLRAALPDLPIAVAARPLVEAALRGVLRHELVGFVALALLSNLALLVFLLRNVPTAAAVLAPPLLAVVGVFAAMWAGGAPIDPINLVVTPLLLGIGVDNGVYLASAARERGDVGAAVTAVGRALVLTSLTTIAGFGCLAFSAYPPLATLGQLMTLGLVIALAATVLVLPALLPSRPGAEHPG